MFNANKLRYRVVSIIGAYFFIVASFAQAQAQTDDVSDQQYVFDEVEQPGDFRMEGDFSIHRARLDAIEEGFKVGDEKNIQDAKSEGKLRTFGLMGNNDYEWETDSNRPNVGAGLGFARQHKKGEITVTTGNVKRRFQPSTRFIFRGVRQDYDILSQQTTKRSE